MKKIEQLTNTKGLLSATIIGALLAMFLVFSPTQATAGVSVGVGVNVGGPPPECPYGYYDYPPYACAPAGYWGPEYFYNGIFIGVGPWWGWGYRHGWDGHRFHGYYRWHGREWGHRGWDRGHGGWRDDRQRGEWNEHGHWRH